MRINTLLNNEDASQDGSPATSTPVPIKKGPGRGNWRRNKKTEGSPAAGRDSSHHVPLLPNNGSMFVNETPGIPATPGSGYSNAFGQGSPGRSGQSIAFQPPNTGDHVPTPSYQAQKRHRGVTQHQNALINHRRQQIDYTLDRRIRRIHIRARDKREEEGSFFRAWKRIKLMPSDYDSEEETIKCRKTRDRPADRGGEEDDNNTVERSSRRPAKKDSSNAAVAAAAAADEPARSMLAGFVRVEGTEPSDLGEEAKSLARSLRLCSRRLDRWQEATNPGEAVLRSRERQANGLLYAPRIWEDGPDEDDAPPPPPPVMITPAAAGRKGAGRARKSAGRGRGKGRVARLAVPTEVEDDVDVDVTMEEDGGEGDEGGVEGDRVGGAPPDLDEEDRELLGEVDADESEGEGEGEDQDGEQDQDQDGEQDQDQDQDGDQEDEDETMADE